uniref:Uncharacterized protein n=1 Tax=viral metagenome TaxID=1070528 RepID=A0A6C0JZ35_9ZZZZ
MSVLNEKRCKIHSKITPLAEFAVSLNQLILLQFSIKKFIASSEFVFYKNACLLHFF